MRRGLLPSRERAREAVEAGQVLVAGSIASKPARLVAPGDPIALAGPPPRFVGRGGLKLAAALERFAIGVTGSRALDAGASTGGFTDCLLQAGAASVTAVDVGRNQLHERLRGDPRVVSLERTDVRALGDAPPGAPYGIVVADLSFISLRTVLPALLAHAEPGAPLVLLVKPQFEVGRADASRGRGVISDPQLWQQALRDVGTALGERGAAIMDAMVSPIRGSEGNVEFLVHACAPGGPPVVADPAALERALAEATAEGDA